MSGQNKLFRDPIHDIISFDLDDPTEALLFRLINTKPVQRLRRIRQLGMSFLVYHGAEHTRFSHSLGVCHLVLKMHDQLYPRRDDGDRAAVGAAALLHDLGHGPFSHVMERITQEHHESRSLQWIEDPESEIHQVLEQSDPTLPGRVASILQRTHPCSALSDLVSSQLDADRLDYILRDGHATGVKIGTYDLGRIVGMLDTVEGHMVVNHRALQAVEGYLLARFHMYTQVYLHKTSRAAEQMLGALFLRIRTLHEAGESVEGADDKTPLGKLIRGEDMSLDDHISFDDTDLWVAFKRWAKASDTILRDLAIGLVSRQLYKTVTIDAADPRGIKGAIEDARQEVIRSGLDPDYHLLVDRGADTPYQPYQPGMKAEPIRILTSHDHVRPIEKCSDVVRLLGESYHETVRLCVPESLRQRIKEIASLEGAPTLV